MAAHPPEEAISPAVHAAIQGKRIMPPRGEGASTVGRLDSKIKNIAVLDIWLRLPENFRDEKELFLE